MQVADTCNLQCMAEKNLKVSLSHIALPSDTTKSHSDWKMLLLRFSEPGHCFGRIQEKFKLCMLKGCSFFSKYCYQHLSDVENVITH